MSNTVGVASSILIYKKTFPILAISANGRLLDTLRLELNGFVPALIHRGRKYMNLFQFWYTEAETKRICSSFDTLRLERNEIVPALIHRGWKQVNLFQLWYTEAWTKRICSKDSKWQYGINVSGDGRSVCLMSSHYQPGPLFTKR